MIKNQNLDRYVHFFNKHGILFTGRKWPGKMGFLAVLCMPGSALRMLPESKAARYAG